MLVYLARSDVLRSREIYADRAAVGWERTRGSGSCPTRRRRPAGRGGRWPPSSSCGTAIRAGICVANAFTDPSVLYIDRSLPMFLTGTAAVLIDASRADLLADAGDAGRGGDGHRARGRRSGHRRRRDRTVAFGALLGGHRRPGAPGLWAGVWLGAGAAFAAIVSSQAVGIRWLPGQPQYLLVLVLAAGAFAWWFTQSARLWLAVSGGSARARMAGHGPVAGGRLRRAVGMVRLVAGDRVPGWRLTGWHVDAWRQILEQSFPGPSGAHLGMLSAIAVVWMNVTLARRSRHSGLRSWSCSCFRCRPCCFACGACWRPPPSAGRRAGSRRRGRWRSCTRSGETRAFRASCSI